MNVRAMLLTLPSSGLQEDESPYIDVHPSQRAAALSVRSDESSKHPSYHSCLSPQQRNLGGTVIEELAPQCRRDASCEEQGLRTSMLEDRKSIEYS